MNRKYKLLCLLLFAFAVILAVAFSRNLKTWEYSVIGAAIGIASTTVIMVSYLRNKQFWQTHLDLLAFRAVCHFGLALRFLLEPVFARYMCGDFVCVIDGISLETWNKWSRACPWPAAMMQFFEISSECWFLCLAVDLYFTLSNPFSSFKIRSNFYHRGSWIFSAVISLLLVSIPNLNGFWSAAYDMKEEAFCWIKGYETANSTVFDADNDRVLNEVTIQKGFNYKLWIMFYIPLSIAYLYAVRVLYVAFNKLQDGISSTFFARIQVLLVNTTNVLVFTLYWTVIGIIYGTMYAIYPSSEEFSGKNDGSTYAHLYDFIIFALPMKGFADLLVWVLVVDMSDAKDEADNAVNFNAEVRREVLSYATWGIREATKVGHLTENPNCDHSKVMLYPKAVEAQHKIQIREFLHLLFSLTDTKTLMKNISKMEADQALNQDSTAQDSKKKASGNGSADIDDQSDNFVSRESKMKESIDDSSTFSQDRTHCIVIPTRDSIAQHRYSASSPTSRIVSERSGNVSPSSRPTSLTTKDRLSVVEMARNPMVVEANVSLTHMSHADISESEYSETEEGKGEEAQVAGGRAVALSEDTDTTYGRDNLSIESIDTTVPISKNRFSRSQRIDIELEKVIMVDRFPDQATVSNRASTGDISLISRPHFSWFSSLKIGLHRWWYTTTSNFSNDRRAGAKKQKEKYLVKFTEYEPRFFRRVRLRYGVDDAQYVKAFEAIIKERLTEGGASGAFFFFSECEGFIAKSCTQEELDNLREMAQTYSEHMTAPNTASFITKVFGAYRLNIYGISLNFLVMENIFPTDETVNEKYDIKGSYVKRNATPPNVGDSTTCKHCNEKFIFTRKGAKASEKKSKIMPRSDTLTQRTSSASSISPNGNKLRKDQMSHSPTSVFGGEYDDSASLAIDMASNDPLNRCTSDANLFHEPNLIMKDNDLKYKLSLPEETRIEIYTQIRRDSRFLMMNGVMDYSLLLGVHNTSYDRVGHNSPSESSTSLPKIRADSAATQESVDSLESNTYALRASPDSKQRNGGGSLKKRRIEVSKVVGPASYYMGIVDFLQKWSISKKGERFFKRFIMGNDGDGLSSMEPMQYRLRFLKRMRELLNLSNDEDDN